MNFIQELCYDEYREHAIDICTELLCRAEAIHITF